MAEKIEDPRQPGPTPPRSVPFIEPTVGRVVWFHNNNPHTDARIDRLQPEAALIVYVATDRIVNLTVFGQDGHSRAEVCVPLMQGDNEPYYAQRFCSWMPYQKGQAAKTEALERTLAATEK